MARLIFDGYALINGTIVKEYKTKQNETLDLCLFSPLSCFFYGNITIKNNKLSKNSRLFVLDWGNTYEIKALPLPDNLPPLALEQKSYVYNGKEYMLTVYKDNSIKFLLETENQHLPVAPVKEVTSPCITVSEIDTSLFFTVTALCQNQQYLLILQAAPIFQKVLEKVGDKIELNNTDITITKTIDDMLMRTYVKTYSYKNNKFVVSSSMFSYANEHRYIAELSPYLLLESIKTGDIDYAKTLLADNLVSKAEYLIDYFGPIGDIRFPKYSNLSLDCVAVTYSDGKVRLFKFVTQNSLITNIKEL